MDTALLRCLEMKRNVSHKESSRWLYLMKHNVIVDGEREINLISLDTSYNWWQIIELLGKEHLFTW